MKKNSLLKNKFFYLVTGLVVIIIGLLIFILCNISHSEDSSQTNETKGQFITKNVDEEKVHIKKSEASAVTFEKFDNRLISLDIPKGWKVQIKEDVDYPFYTFMAYNPNDKNYSLFVNLKFEGYLKSQAAKNWYIKTYGSDYVFSKMPVLEKLSAEYYFKKVFNQTAALNNSGDFTFPTLNQFSLIENFGATVYGGDLIRASYTDNNGAKVEGLFTASPKDMGNYYVNENIVSGKKIDAYFRNVYDTIFITAPESEFVNWESTLTKCMNSIEFSDAFINGFNNSQDATMRTIKANSQIYNEISDMVMASWDARNHSYDITSQKRSDATLGYERVYDTETGEIYKAYNGFTDDYQGKRYQPITDDMYTQSIAGYIEK